ncbi:unnamed protein product [Camellia sinensis]
MFLNVISIPDILLTQRRRKRFDVFNQCMGLPWMVDHLGHALEPQSIVMPG